MDLQNEFLKASKEVFWNKARKKLVVKDIPHDSTKHPLFMVLLL